MPTWKAEIKKMNLSPMQLDAIKKQNMLHEAYLDPHHLQHKDAVEAVQAITEIEAEREVALETRRAKRPDAGLEDVNKKYADPSIMTPSQRRMVMQLYGPKPGKDTPSYREGLTPQVRGVIEHELGSSAADKDVDAFGNEVD